MVANAFGDAAGLLQPVVEIDHANPVLKGLQEVRHFAGNNVLVNIVHQVRARGLHHLRFQGGARAGIHADAQHSDAQLGGSGTVNGQAGIHGGQFPFGAGLASGSL
jgi:hypothetical protein